MANAADLKDLLSRRDLPAGLVWAVAEPVDDLSQLFPVEREAMARAVPKRRAEFTGGRIAARAALRQMGLADQPIPKGADRAPVWPEGVVASISHAGGLCLAMAARRADWRGLGIDIEIDQPMEMRLAATIAHVPELARLSPLPFSRAAVRIFSAKEAAYKAQYPLTNCLFGFDAMESLLPEPRMRMVAEMGLGRGAEFPIQQIVDLGVILSICTISNG